MSKLNKEQVKQIRKMREQEKMLIKDIHKHFPDVTVWTIYKVCSYAAWPLC